MIKVRYYNESTEETVTLEIPWKTKEVVPPPSMAFFNRNTRRFSEFVKVTEDD